VRKAKRGSPRTATSASDDQQREHPERPDEEELLGRIVKVGRNELRHVVDDGGRIHEAQDVQVERKSERVDAGDYEPRHAEADECEESVQRRASVRGLRVDGFHECAQAEEAEQEEGGHESPMEIRPEQQHRQRHQGEAAQRDSPPVEVLEPQPPECGEEPGEGVGSSDEVVVGHQRGAEHGEYRRPGRGTVQSAAAQDHHQRRSEERCDRHEGPVQPEELVEGGEDHLREPLVGDEGAVRGGEGRGLRGQHPARLPHQIAQQQMESEVSVAAHERRCLGPERPRQKDAEPDPSRERREAKAHEHGSHAVPIGG
jgi:hypothetical protein